MGIELDDLKDLLARSQQNDIDARRALEVFAGDWNSSRDGRPAFAAPYDEVMEEVEDDNWPHELRDRLGLGHYVPAGFGPVPVALVRYPFHSVQSARTGMGLPVDGCLPTVLDGGMHQFFFPSPKEQPFGATVHLASGKAEVLTAEILHCRIDYTYDHIQKVGLISDAHTCAGGNLVSARDLHLLSLQIESERPDFGREMAR